MIRNINTDLDEGVANRMWVCYAIEYGCRVRIGAWPIALAAAVVPLSLSLSETELVGNHRSDRQDETKSNDKGSINEIKKFFFCCCIDEVRTRTMGGGNGTDKVQRRRN